MLLLAELAVVVLGGTFLVGFYGSKIAVTPETFDLLSHRSWSLIGFAIVIGAASAATVQMLNQFLPVRATRRTGSTPEPGDPLGPRLGAYDSVPGRGRGTREGGGEAVGRHGWPLQCWYKTVETDLGHGDYWKTWRDVLENIPKMLRAAGPQLLPERPDGSRSSQLPRSELPTREPDPRQIGEPLYSDWQELFEPASM